MSNGIVETTSDITDVFCSIPEDFTTRQKLQCVQWFIVKYDDLKFRGIITEVVSNEY